MGNIALLRLDRMGGFAPGNKSFKLSEYFDSAKEQGITRLVSFGGAWSNHLHALAAAGHEYGFETVGIVRGEAASDETARIFFWRLASTFGNSASLTRSGPWALSRIM